MKEIKDLKKEDCEQLLSYATDKEKEMYHSFGDSWQMGLVMSGIWANYCDKLGITGGDKKTSKTANKDAQIQSEKESQASEEQEEPHKSIYNSPIAFIPKKDIKDPDFNFGDEYAIGQTVFLVKCFPTLSKYEVLRLKLRSIYNRLMVGTVESGYCECIGYDMKDSVFMNELAANEYLAELKVKFPPKTLNDRKDD